MPVSDEQGDLTGLPIFASHAVAVDHDHRGRGNGGPIASLPTEVVPEEQRPVSLSASELAGENIDWGLVRGFRKQAAEILSNELRDRSVGAERERKIGRARATPTVSHVGVFLDQVAWSLLILKARHPHSRNATPTQPSDSATLRSEEPVLEWRPTHDRCAACRAGDVSETEVRQLRRCRLVRARSPRLGCARTRSVAVGWLSCD